MRVKFGFRARFRLHRKFRGFLPLRRALFARRVRRLSPRKVVELLDAELQKGVVGTGAPLPVLAACPVTLDELLAEPEQG